MNSTLRRALVAPASIAFALALAPACSGGGGKLDKFEMTDLQAPAMFVRLAGGRDEAFVLEIPPGPVNLRFDLDMKNVTEREILDELVKRDPAFQHAEPNGVLVFWPTGKDDAGSPYSKSVEAFKMEGSIGDVISAMMRTVQDPVEVRAEKVAGRRPVHVDVKSGVLRDVLADLARQAHVGLILAPHRISVVRVHMPDTAPSQSESFDTQP